MLIFTSKQWRIFLGSLAGAIFLILAPAAHSWAASNKVMSNEYCLACHSEKSKSKYPIDGRAFNDSVHGQFTCVSCHWGIHQGEGGTKKEARNPKTCETCHPDVVADYSKSSHGVATKNGNCNAPTCSDCHNPHYSTHEDVAKLATNDTQTCLKCHHEITQSYEYSFHGTARKLGWSKAPTCASCHGPAHDIVGPTNPASPVAQSNVPQTCARCHANPNPNFSQGKEHVVPQDKASAFPLWLTWKFFMGLILFDTLKDGPIVILELWRRMWKT